MTVTLCHRYTPPEDLVDAVQASDLVVSAAGVPGIITRFWIELWFIILSSVRW